MRNRSLLLVAASGAVGLSGCVAGAVGAAGAVGVMAVQDRTIGQGVDDATAAAEIKTKLLSVSSSAYGSVHVEVANGFALLTGSVPTYEHRLAAERVAWIVDRVQGVGNELEIGGAGRRDLATQARDEALTARIRTRLLQDKAIKGVNFNIETRRGVAYLLGIARTPYELERAAWHASRVEGVERVVSYVEVRPFARSLPPAALGQSSGAAYPNAPYPGGQPPGPQAPLAAAPIPQGVWTLPPVEPK